MDAGGWTAVPEVDHRMVLAATEPIESRMPIDIGAGVRVVWLLRPTRIDGRVVGTRNGL
jgi:hypothetical protein